jgi:hypothetical protein
MGVSEQGIARGAGRLCISPAAYRAHIADDERWCTWHRGWEPITAFNPSRMKRGGVQNNCRDGNREYQREWQRSRRAPAARPRGEAAS